MKIPQPEITSVPENNEEEFMARSYWHHLHVNIGNHEIRERLVAAIQCRAVVGGSDGSLMNKEMVIGWVLEKRKKYKIEGLGPVDGDLATNYSIRVERGDQISILCVILQIVE